MAAASWSLGYYFNSARGTEIHQLAEPALRSFRVIAATRNTGFDTSSCPGDVWKGRTLNSRTQKRIMHKMIKYKSDQLHPSAANVACQCKDCDANGITDYLQSVTRCREDSLLHSSLEPFSSPTTKCCFHHFL